MGLRKLCWKYQETSNRRWGKDGQGWKGSRTRALRVGACRVEMSRMMTRVLVTAMLVRGTRRIRVAQHDGESPIDRREHEAGGDEGAKAQHRQDERRSPVVRTSASQPALSLAHRVPRCPTVCSGSSGAS